MVSFSHFHEGKDVFYVKTTPYYSQKRKILCFEHFKEGNTGWPLYWSFLLSFLFYYIFSTYHLFPSTPLYLHPPPSFSQLPHCGACPWILSLYFLFCLVPSVPSTPRALGLLSIYESVFSLFIRSFSLFYKMTEKVGELAIIVCDLFSIQVFCSLGVSWHTQCVCGQCKFLPDFKALAKPWGAIDSPLSLP